MNIADAKKGLRLGKKSRRVGRGEASGRGKTSGRGSKGYTARSGSSVGLTYEGGQMPLFQKLAKRGFSNAKHKHVYSVVNVKSLNVFDDGASVGVIEIKEKGWVDNLHDGLKILGDGEISRKLSVKAQAFSAKARKAIEDAGGSCEVVPMEIRKKAAK